MKIDGGWDQAGLLATSHLMGWTRGGGCPQEGPGLGGHELGLRPTVRELLHKHPHPCADDRRGDGSSGSVFAPGAWVIRHAATKMSEEERRSVRKKKKQALNRVLYVCSNPTTPGMLGCSDRVPGWNRPNRSHTLLLRGPEGLPEAVGVVVDQRGSRLHDVGGRAVRNTLSWGTNAPHQTLANSRGMMVGVGS